MSDLLSFFIDHCYAWEQAQSVLASYGYIHDPLRLGYLGGGKVKTSSEGYFELDENGEFMILQPVWAGSIPCLENPNENPILDDVIAWHPKNPDRWYFLRKERGLILGHDNYFMSSHYGEKLSLYRTPFAWLQAGCAGCVLLDKHSLTHLYGLGDVVCRDTSHGLRIEKALHAHYAQNLPRISIPVSGLRIQP